MTRCWSSCGAGGRRAVVREVLAGLPTEAVAHVHGVLAREAARLSAEEPTAAAVLLAAMREALAELAGRVFGQEGAAIVAEALAEED